MATRSHCRPPFLTPGGWHRGAAPRLPREPENRPISGSLVTSRSKLRREPPREIRRPSEISRRARRPELFGCEESGVHGRALRGRHQAGRSPPPTLINRPGCSDKLLRPVGARLASLSRRRASGSPPAWSLHPPSCRGGSASPGRSEAPARSRPPRPVRPEHGSWCYGARFLHVHRAAGAENTNPGSSSMGAAGIRGRARWDSRRVGPALYGTVWMARRPT
jgi:hypothetical protein